MKYLSLLIFLLPTCLLPISAVGAEPEYVLIIQNHKFEPTEVKIPAGKKVKLQIQNKDSTPEEFHSDDLKREKIILGNKTAFVLLGPLSPGRYKFMGEFHESTAQGVVVVE